MTVSGPGGRKPPTTSRLRRPSASAAGITLALVVLLVLSQLVVTDHFYQRASLSVLTPLIGIMAILTIGQAIVIGTGGIDLSVAAVVTLVGQVVLKQSQGQSQHLAGALLACLLACVVVGLVNGVLVEALHLNALVVTLAVGQLVAGFAQSYSGQVQQFGIAPPNLATFASDQVGGISVIVMIAVGLALLAAAFVHRFVSGRRLVLSSAARRTALLAGIRANMYRILAYVVAACLYGVGGVLAAGQIRTPNLTLGDPYLLATIAAAVLGGAALTGGRVSLGASVVGATFLTILDYDLQVKGYSSGVQTMAQGVALVAALTLALGVGRWSTLRTRLGRTDSSTTDEPATSPAARLSTNP